jgi:hypothetical protein
MACSVRPMATVPFLKEFPPRGTKF